MVHVLVTGPAGTIGSVLVPRLAARGHQVRVLAHTQAPDYPPEVEVTHGNVRRLGDLAAADDGIDVIVHGATSVFSKANATEVEGVRAAVAAAEHVGAHLIYPSIVGVEDLSGTYYKAKWAAEQIVVNCGTGWTIQRATQLHPTLDRTIGRVFPVTANLSFQPVDPAELADCLIGHVEAGPGGRAEDFGGPEVLTLRHLVATRRAISGKRTILIRVPAIGPLHALDAGHHLAPEHARGQRTWQQWLHRLLTA